MATPTTAKTDTTLGFSRFSFPRNRSMTRSILLGSDYPHDREIEIQDIEKVSQINTLELLGKFPFEICSRLVSIMGKDLEAESLYSPDKDGVEGYIGHCTMTLAKAMFLLSPSAFPVRNNNPADFILKLAGYVALLNNLAGTYDSGVSSFFEIPCQEELSHEFKNAGDRGCQLIFPYELLRSVGNYYSSYVGIDESDAVKIAKLKGKDREIFTTLLERLCAGYGSYPYGVVVGSSSDQGYTAILAFGGESGVSVAVDFCGADVSSVRLKIVKSLVKLEGDIKYICSDLLRAWNRFIVEPRQLRPAGVLRLYEWWDSILKSSYMADQLFRFPSLVGRLGIIGIEVSSDKFKDLGRKTVEGYEKYVLERGDKFSERMNKVLSKAEEEASVLYDAMICRNSINKSQHNRSLQFAHTPEARRARMMEYYQENAQNFVKISLQHIESLTMGFAKMDREVPKAFLAKVAGEFGYHNLQKKFIGHWLAKHRRNER